MGSASFVLGAALALDDNEPEYANFRGNIVAVAENASSAQQ
jgi:hypothetical protein